MKTLISIDPGLSSGLSVGTYSDTEPYNLKHAFQIEGGVEGFLRKVRVSHYEHDTLLEGTGTLFIGREPFTLYQDYVGCVGTLGFSELRKSDTDVIVEKFTSRGQGNQFAYRTKDLEPLRVEGAILAMGIEPEWVSPQHLYFAGGDSKNPVTNAHRWLKENGLHVTGKDVGCKDADDARSAILHSISWLRRKKHLPTINRYFSEETK